MKYRVVVILFVLFFYPAALFAQIVPVKWGVYVYMDARNVLGRKKKDIKTINELCHASKNNHSVVVFVDRITKKGSWYIFIKNGRKKVFSQKPDKIDNFLLWAGKKVRVRRKMLVLWGVGGFFSFGELSRYAVSYSTMADSIRQGLGPNGGEFDILVIDACEGYSLESIYNLSKVSNYLVASNLTVPYDGYPYDKILNIIKDNPNSTAKIIAKKIGISYVNRYANNSYSIDCAVINLQKALPFTKEIIKEMCLKGNILFNSIIDIGNRSETPDNVLFLITPISQYGLYLSHTGHQCKIEDISNALNGLQQSIVWFGHNVKKSFFTRLPYILIPLKPFFLRKNSNKIFNIYTSNFGSYGVCIGKILKQIWNGQK